MFLLFSRKVSPILIYRPLRIPYILRPSSLHFSSGFENGEGGGHKKKVIKWEPKDSISIKKMNNDHVPSIKSTQTAPIFKSINDQKRKVQGDVIAQTKDRWFSTEYEVDDFIEKSLRFCNLRNISDLMKKSAKVSKQNKNKKSFIIKHLPAIGSQIKDNSSSSSTFRDISEIIYGLQHITAKDTGAIDILSAMTIVTAKTLK
jgi:hypothetical protein